MSALELPSAENNERESWIREGCFDPFLNHWVIDLIYSDHQGTQPGESGTSIEEAFIKAQKCLKRADASFRDAKAAFEAAQANKEQAEAAAVANKDGGSAAAGDNKVNTQQKIDAVAEATQSLEKAKASMLRAQAILTAATVVFQKTQDAVASTRSLWDLEKPEIAVSGSVRGVDTEVASPTHLAQNNQAETIDVRLDDNLVTAPEEDTAPAFRYAIYLDEELAVQWSFEDFNSGSKPSSDVFFPSKFGEIHAGMVHLHILSEGLRRKFIRWPWCRMPPGTLRQRWSSEIAWADSEKLKHTQRQLRAIRWMLGEALARAIGPIPSPAPSSPDQDPRYITAMAALQTARQHLNARSAEIGRFSMLTGACFGLFFTVLLAVLFGWMYSQTLDCSGQPLPFQAWSAGWLTQEGWDVLRIAFVGSLGAMLSLLSSAAGRSYDAGAVPWLHYAEGICRIATGVLGAFFLLAAIKCGLLGSVLVSKSNSSDGWVFTIVALLAGFSERLVPAFAGFLEAKIPSSAAPSNGKN